MSSQRKARPFRRSDTSVGHPSATCPGVATGVTGLQHDAEAAPKGNALVQFPNPYVDTRPAQIVVDATDAKGRCHDQGTLAVTGATQGGLEIIDVTDPMHPTEIGLTRHVGQAHTVNIDPKRPHIAFVSSSDFVNYNAEGVRANDEHPPPPPPPQPPAVTNAMDGIEVVDMSTCMNFLPGASRQFKIDNCRPLVYRYRWPNAAFAQLEPVPRRRRLPRARDLSGRPARMRRRRRHPAARPLEGLRRQRHPDRLLGRQAARHAAALSASGQLHCGEPVEDEREGHRLRHRHGRSCAESARARLAQDDPAAFARGRREARRCPPHGVREPAEGQRWARRTTRARTSGSRTRRS